MRKTAIGMVLVATLVPCAGVAASPASVQRIHLEVASVLQTPTAGPQLTVTGAAGRYDRLETPALSAKLAIVAGLPADSADFKIVKSDLVLKSEGSGATARGSSLASLSAPVSSLETQGDVSFELAPAGPVAQSAISACNALPVAVRTGDGARIAKIQLAVEWRVTTGRFNFRWINYDRVAPSEEIVANRDFYADQEISSTGTVIEATVICQPLQGTAATANATAPAVNTANFVAGETRPETPAPAASVGVADAVHKTASIASHSKPQCDGGMVRRTSGADQAYLCLCPGNTERIATGENAFACEKRSRRR